jgi:site-specific recombinase XerD
LLEQYLSQDFSNDTIKTYRSVLINFFNYLERIETKIENITPETVKDYAKDYKDTTQNKVISVVKTYYKWHTRKDLNLDGITPKSFRPDRQLDINEVKALLKACEDDRDRLMMKTLFTTGIRVKELASIKKSDIKIEEGAYWLHFTAKGNKKRRIKLQSGIARELLNYSSYKPTIFGIGQRQIERIISGLAQQTLSRTITPHCFRHGFATELMKQGVSFQKIQKELGHESISTTLKYLHNKHDNDNWFIEL